MRKSKFTETQIVATLKQVEGGRQVKDVCRELGVSEATLLRVEVKVRRYPIGQVSAKTTKHSCQIRIRRKSMGQLHLYLMSRGRYSKLGGILAANAFSASRKLVLQFHHTLRPSLSTDRSILALGSPRPSNYARATTCCVFPSYI
jgi:hypothetical protein